MGVQLGVSSDYHDAAAAVLVDGKVIAAAAEERFSRVKHDSSMPVQAIRYCLEAAGAGAADLTAATFYSKPLSTYERIVVTHADVGPRGFPAFAAAVGHWTRRKLWAGPRLEAAVRDLGFDAPRVRFAEHHQSHAAAAFYPSPFERAAILTIDGVGEWATSTISCGIGNRIEPLRELHFPDSLGMLYSALTAFCGFAVNDGEYKLMGLAPFGEPVYLDRLRDQVVHLRDDGSVSIDQRWFGYRAGRTMTSPRLDELLDGPPRSPDAPLTERDADVAASAQALIEEAMLAMARHAHRLTGERRAVLAGGVALNCVANSRLREEGPFDEVWVQPAAGDDGSAIGAALWGWHQLDGHDRTVGVGDAMGGALLGPSYRSTEVVAWLVEAGIAFERIQDDEDLVERVSEDLAAGAVVGWFQGRMEFGPRALGNRSILADPRPAGMAAHLNRLVKGREGFRPFAPSVLVERADEWFVRPGSSPYMTFTAAVHPDHRVSGSSGAALDRGAFADRLAVARSHIASCTHLDFSSRVQTVDREVNPRFHALLRAFERRTGCPVLLNTSFNRGDEPIVRTPADAHRCFRGTEIDVLVLEDSVITRDGWSRARVEAGVEAGAGRDG